MITLKLISFFLGLSFFSSFEVSDTTLNSLTSLISFLYQLNSFIDLDTFLDTVFIAVSLNLLLGIVTLIRKKLVG